MTDRIQITQLTYMNIGGQPQLVDKGSVVDVPSGGKFHASNSTILAETPATLNNANHAQAVRNMRFR